MQFHLSKYVFLILVLSSCHSKLKNRASTLSSNCEIPVESLNKGTEYIKFLDTNSLPLNGKELRFYNQFGEEVAMEVSPAGCVEVEDIEAWPIVVSRPSQNAGTVLDKDLVKRLDVDESLKKAVLKKFDYGPLGGICEDSVSSNDRAVLNLPFNDVKQSAGYQILYTFNSIKDQRTLNTWLGVDGMTTIPMNLQDSSDGFYELQIDIVELFSIDRKKFSKKCSYKLDRHAPIIEIERSNFFDQQLEALDANDSIKLSVQDNVSKVEVYYCWRRLALSTQSNCAYQKADNETIDLPAPGDWSLEYFAEDEAGNKSTVFRQPIKVADFKVISQISELYNSAQKFRALGKSEKAALELLKMHDLYALLQTDFERSRVKSFLSDLYMELVVSDIPTVYHSGLNAYRTVGEWVSDDEVVLQNKAELDKGCDILNFQSGVVSQAGCFAGRGGFVVGDQNNIMYRGPKESLDYGLISDVLNVETFNRIEKLGVFAVVRITENIENIPVARKYLLSSLSEKPMALDPDFSYKILEFGDRVGVLTKLDDRNFPIETRLLPEFSLNEQMLREIDDIKFAYRTPESEDFLVGQVDNQFVVWAYGKQFEIDYSGKPNAVKFSSSFDLVMFYENENVSIYNINTGAKVGGVNTYGTTRIEGVGSKVVLALEVESNNVVAYDLNGQKLRKISYGETGFDSVSINGDDVIIGITRKNEVLAYDLSENIASRFNEFGIISGLMSTNAGFLYRANMSLGSLGGKFNYKESLFSLDLNSNIKSVDFNFQSTSIASGLYSLAKSIDYFENDGEQFVVAGYEGGGVNFWNFPLKSNQPLEVRSVFTSSSGWTQVTEVSRDGKWVVYGSSDGFLVLIDSKERMFLSGLNLALADSSYSKRQIEDVEFANIPNLFFATDSKGNIHKLEIDSDKMELNKTLSKSIQSNSGLILASLAEDEVILLGTGNGELVYLNYNLDEINRIDIDPSNSSRITDIQLLDNGDILVGSYGGTLTRVSHNDSKLNVMPFFSNSYGPKHLALSKNGEVLAVTNGTEVVLIEMSIDSQLNKLCKWFLPRSEHWKLEFSNVDCSEVVSKLFISE